MQTFLISDNPEKTAKILDYRRLGKQRVETIQILNSLLNLNEGKRGWKNHPAVKMWRGYEPYLLKVYLKSIIGEWVDRGYKNEKCAIRYKELYNVLKDKEIVEPEWFSEEFFNSHKSNLIRKKPDYYRKYWKDIPDNIEYIWPVK
jgi:hypothetical protein